VTWELAAAEQVFDRENAVEYYVIFAAEHGGVNPETSYGETGCDGLLVPKAMLHRTWAILCRHFSAGDHFSANASRSMVELSESRLV